MLTWPFRGNNSGKMAVQQEPAEKARKARALAVITTILPIFIKRLQIPPDWPTMAVTSA